MVPKDDDWSLIVHCVCSLICFLFVFSERWAIFFLNSDVSLTSSVVQVETSPGQGDFFPNLPILRGRGVYQAYSTKNAAVCSKATSRHPTLLPGLFTLFCQHGVCGGFSVMGSCESLNNPFTIFKTRFETVPKTIIYDNACNLHSYFLNRDPVSIRSTRFVVDGLHWKNHTCSPAYNSKQYPNLMSVNTQVVEKTNSTLKKLRTQISYMTPDHFVQQLALFIFEMNRRSKHTLV